MTELGTPIRSPLRCNRTEHLFGFIQLLKTCIENFLNFLDIMAPFTLIIMNTGNFILTSSVERGYVKIRSIPLSETIGAIGGA